MVADVQAQPRIRLGDLPTHQWEPLYQAQVPHLSSKFAALCLELNFLLYQVLLVVIKLDVYFVIAFIVVYGLVDVHYEIPEFPLTIALIPILWIQLTMTIIFTKRENKPGAIAALVGLIFQ